MSDLNISKKSIYNIFAERGINFLIPDYQRNYSWEHEHCETLWEDFKAFAFPNDNPDLFDVNNDEYFLGTIVTFRNEYKQNEVIDGQQRLITILLLLRAFYESFGDNHNKVCDKISECIWQMDKNDNPDKSQLKIKSEVASDDSIAEFERIISTGKTLREDKSLYAQNYKFFQKKIAEFKNDNANNFSDLPRRILNNCVLLPIETHSQNTALEIFTTLNDRGMPLSDSDIFKAQFYKFYKSRGKQCKEKFVASWKELEEFCNKNFHPRTGTPIDDLFMRYMYYLLAKSGTKSDTFHGLRPFYEKNNYEILQSEKTFEDLITLKNFWQSVFERDEERFSERVLKKIFVLSYCPYSLWAYIVSLYFMGNRDENNLLDDKKFYDFLDKTTLMFLMYSTSQSGVQAVRRPFFLEFQNILHGRELKFKDFRKDKKFFYEQLTNMKFSNTKPITRAMLVWWAFEDENQKLPPLGIKLEIEHIYAKKRNEFEPLKESENLELLGNKSLLEEGINIRAADYRFRDKKFIYLGRNKSGQATKIAELRKLAESQNNFTESDILRRNEKIFNHFIERLDMSGLFIKKI